MVPCRRSMSMARRHDRFPASAVGRRDHVVGHWKTVSENCVRKLCQTTSPPVRPELRLVNIARGAPRTPEARHDPPKVHSSKQTWGRSTPEEVDEEGRHDAVKKGAKTRSGRRGGEAH